MAEGRSIKSTKQNLSLPKNSLGLTCLNAGCGEHYLKDWVNLDLVQSEYVQDEDLGKGISYPDSIFDLVYSSNLIEHFSCEVAQRFMQELFRVLKPKGTIRLLTPDLEQMAEEYLKNLKAWAQDKSEINRQRYEWILLEMFDQMTREKRGGLMFEKVQAGEALPEYVIQRTGDELRYYLCPETKGPSQKNRNFLQKNGFSKKPLFCRIWIFLKDSLKEIYHFIIKPRKKVPFSESGERHKWYYDRVSLEYLFKRVGFVDFKVVDYKTSRIPGWEKMNLDISDFGDSPRKPDSIIVEASRP